ncbi:MAG: cobalt ECF transporter T component CbiQ [Richelia sp. RM2_1_2]|nr:cobalt ECF transporter T component CbiQ [Richelia sp. SM1_7_0]NJN07232.1 cobalt ECF transporter T component CbiQ [Richelia sp. RM1_1_1]NJO27844.1 cobalt ECF transporter T component CbiQ [Richelia sp. SL_2_1]NJO57523.1 cobalt ECF transporter T component CbiQ [Richelia sp. RM2_1_2]
MSLKLDTLAYTNKLRGLPPEHKLIFALTTLLISLSTHPPIQILIALWMGIWTVVYAKIPAGTYFKILAVASFFWLTSLPALIINAISIADVLKVQNDAWQGFTFSSYYIYISPSGFYQALNIFTRAFASVSCLYFLMLTVPFTEVLQTLRRFKFPTLLIELLLLMYRFIFILWNTATDLSIAQQSRLGYRNFRTSIKSLALLVGQLLKRTLQKYSQFSLGLEARGMSGEFRVYAPRRYRSSTRYIIEAIIGWVILIVLEWWLNARIFT